MNSGMRDPCEESFTALLYECCSHLTVVSDILFASFATGEVRGCPRAATDPDQSEGAEVHTSLMPCINSVLCFTTVFSHASLQNSFNLETHLTTAASSPPP
jgi:hypothetical protein